MADEGIVWLDVETTGIDANNEHLLEVGCIITDLDLNILDPEGYRAAVYYPESIVEQLKTNAVPFVQEMHTKTGLWDELPKGELLSTINDQLSAYVKGFFPDERTAWLGGNSIVLDRNFINRFIPKVGEHLHYRSVDVTSWAGPAQWWMKGLQYRKKTVHSAFSDITESIEEFKFLKDNMLIPKGISSMDYKPKVEGDYVTIGDWSFNVNDEQEGADHLGVSLIEYVEHNVRVFAELAKTLKATQIKGDVSE